jgi:hypothetical protein
MIHGRSRCLCRGGTAGTRNVITPVALGSSAAIKVLRESLVEALADANADREGHDGKERLLIFSDSRQDAAHQARFIIFTWKMRFVNGEGSCVAAGGSPPTNCFICVAASWMKCACAACFRGK